MLEAGEVAEALQALAVSAKDSGLVCSTYRVAHNVQGFQHPSSGICRHTHTKL